MYISLIFVPVKIADREKENKMSASNLSVCFGPVFMWRTEESCEAIFDVRHQCSGMSLFLEISVRLVFSRPTSDRIVGPNFSRRN